MGKHKRSKSDQQSDMMTPQPSSGSLFSSISRRWSSVAQAAPPNAPSRDGLPWRPLAAIGYAGVAVGASNSDSTKRLGYTRMVAVGDHPAAHNSVAAHADVEVEEVEEVVSHNQMTTMLDYKRMAAVGYHPAASTTCASCTVARPATARMVAAGYLPSITQHRRRVITASSCIPFVDMLWVLAL